MSRPSQSQEELKHLIAEGSCPMCGSFEVGLRQRQQEGRAYYHCKDCGYTCDFSLAQIRETTLNLREAEKVRWVYWDPNAAPLK